jgi:hypothetical protein
MVKQEENYDASHADDLKEQNEEASDEEKHLLAVIFAAIPCKQTQ